MGDSIDQWLFAAPSNIAPEEVDCSTYMSEVLHSNVSVRKTMFGSNFKVESRILRQQDIKNTCISKQQQQQQAATK